MAHLVGLILRHAVCDASVALIFATTFGSFVRLGETMREEFGDLSELTALDLLIVALNGSDDVATIRERQRQMKEAFVGTLEEIADVLDRASDPPTIIPEVSLLDTTGPTTRSDIRRVANRFRELADRLAGLPLFNLLGSPEFFAISNEARVQIERLENSYLWRHIPNHLKAAMQTCKSIYTPRICEIVEMVFASIQSAIPRSLVLDIPRETLEYVASRLDLVE